MTGNGKPNIDDEKWLHEVVRSHLVRAIFEIASKTNADNAEVMQKLSVILLDEAAVMAVEAANVLRMELAEQ